MYILQPSGTIIGNIYKSGATKHSYDTVSGHYKDAEFDKGIENFKKTLDLEKMVKRLTKFIGITTNQNVYIYLGQLFIKNAGSSFDILLNKEGIIVYGGIGYSEAINSGKTLANTPMSSTYINYKTDEIEYKYNDIVYAIYKFNEDIVELKDGIPVSCINNFNSFLTKHCNKTLRVAVAIEDTVEIMEISY